MNLKDTFGLYQWNVSLGVDYIYPDDINKALKAKPFGNVRRCIEDDGIYLTLEKEGMIFRGKRDLYVLIPTPKYKIGESVKLKKYFDKEVIIKDIGWHFKDEKHMYFVSIDGKVKTKRYYEENFEN